MPAAAVRQGRQALVIFIRFKGYLDGVQRLKLVPVTLEFNMWEENFRIIGGEIEFCDTYKTDNGEGKPLCIKVLYKEVVEKRILRENFKVLKLTLRDEGSGSEED